MALKLANFAAIDPDYQGGGMTRGGIRERYIWDTYAYDSQLLQKALDAILSGIDVTAPLPPSEEERTITTSQVEDDSVEGYEYRNRQILSTAELRERSLVLRYSVHLESLGHVVERHRYESPSSSALECDLFDVTENVLYEAKSTVDRNHLRLALGQLWDYRRFESGNPSLAVLLPKKPVKEMIDLNVSCDVTTVWESEHGFQSQAPD